MAEPGTTADPPGAGPGPGTCALLVVDDDPALRRLTRDFLAGQGYTVHEAKDATSMRRVLSETAVDILILDIMMPGEDGLSITRGLAGQSALGIIMVSARSSEADRITGLETGADDYLPKPASPNELLARIRALQRRRLPGSPTRRSGDYAFENWRLDPIRRLLRDPAGTIIGLSEGEFSLLLAFVENPATILSRDALLDLARGSDFDGYDRAIDTQVSRLRRKLSARISGDIIRTIRNEGYIFLPKVSRP